MKNNIDFATVFDAFKDSSQYDRDIESLLPYFESQDVNRVIDVGCGTGNHSAVLASKDYEVIGVDIDESMLSVARRKHPDLTFKQQSAEESLTSTSAITLFDSVFTYLSPEQRAEAIASYSDAINEGGVLYLDIAFTTKTTPQTGWEDAETVMWQDTRYEKETSTERFNDEVHSHLTIRSKDNGKAVNETTHVHHIVNPDQLRTMLRAKGFSIIDERGHQSEPWKNWEVICARR